MSVVFAALRGWLVQTAVALAAVLALGAWPTLRWAGDGASGAVAAGVAVALAGAVLGTLPVLRALAEPARAKPQVAAGWAMALRAGGTLTGALAVALGSRVPRAPFLAWVAIAYGVLLVVETRWMVRWLQASEG